MAPEAASNWAARYDVIFYTIVALTVFFTLIVGVFLLFFTVRFRQGSPVNRENPIHGHLPLEITWSIIPLILGVVIFFVGAQLFVEMRKPPDDAQEIFVIGKQWMWHIQHANGVREMNTLTVPVGVPIKLTMISQDVLHAFYIPEFRIQYHVVPGRYTQEWFTATKPGKYRIFCGLYCGTQHSEMGGFVYVKPQAEYARWLANGGTDVPQMTMEQSGAAIFTRMACGNCHGPVDSARAPSLYGIAGTTRKLEGGQSIVADDAYLRESILRPWDKISLGYGNTMPAYDKQISEEDILQLVAYIRALGTPRDPAKMKFGTTDEPKIGSNPNDAAMSSGPTMSVGALGAKVTEESHKNGELAVGATGAQVMGTTKGN